MHNTTKQPTNMDSSERVQSYTNKKPNNAQPKADWLSSTHACTYNELSLLSEQITNVNVTAERHSKYSNRKHC